MHTGNAYALAVTGDGARQQRPMALFPSIQACKAGTALWLLLGASGLPHSAHAQQVLANGTTVTAAGLVDMGTTGGDAGIGLRAINGGAIETSSPVTVITRGGNAIGVQALSNSRIDLFDGTTIHTTGSGGDGIASSFGSLVTAVGTDVLTENIGYGLIAGASGRIEMTDSSIRALIGTGVASFAAGQITLTNSTVDTGTGLALWVQDVNSKLIGDGLTVTSGARGALVLQGALDLTDSSITSSGIGIQTASSATVDLTNTSITTTGNSAYGVYLSGGSSLAMDGGSIATSGAGARAIYGGPGTNAATITGGR